MPSEDQRIGTWDAGDGHSQGAWMPKPELGVFLGEDEWEEIVPKSFLASKTILFNLALLILTGVMTAVEGGNLPPELATWGPAIAAVGNVILRFFTTSPIRVLRPKEDSAL